MGEPRYGLTHITVLEFCGGAEQLWTKQNTVLTSQTIYSPL